MQYLAHAKKGNQILSKVKVNVEAPQFALKDYESKEITLSQYRNVKNVLLVFSRGFL
jgi:peroxiredoxin